MELACYSNHSTRYALKGSAFPCLSLIGAHAISPGFVIQVLALESSLDADVLLQCHDIKHFICQFVLSELNTIVVSHYPVFNIRQWPKQAAPHLHLPLQQRLH